MANYQPQSVEFADTAPIRFEGEVVVDVSPEALWEVLIDNPRWPEWFGSPVTKVVQTSSEATGVGSTRRVHLGPGRGAVVDERFIAWEPHRLWAFTGVSGPGIFRSLVERCTIHVEGPGRTRLTYRMAIDPAPALAPVMRLLGKGVSRSLTQGMARLAERAGTAAAARR